MEANNKCKKMNDEHVNKLKWVAQALNVLSTDDYTVSYSKAAYAT